MLKLYEEFEMMMGETQVKFSAWQSQKEDVTGALSIKYQTCDAKNRNYSKLYDSGIKLSLLQWQHFQHDINPADKLHYYLRQSTANDLYRLPDPVCAVVAGHSEHLGRGNSWNGYRIGAYVIKLSSIVPYIWQNSHGYLSVTESYTQAMREVKINQAMSGHPKLTGRVAWITDVTEVGQKIAVTMPYLAPIDQLTQQQAEYLEETIHRMHRLGYAYLDQEIGFGLDEDTKMPVIYDLSTVRHRSELDQLSNWKHWIEDDLNVIDRLFEKHGLPCSKTSRLRSDLRRKRYDRIREILKPKV